MDSSDPRFGRCNFFMWTSQASHALHAVLPDACTRNVDKLIPSSPNSGQIDSQTPHWELWDQRNQWFRWYGWRREEEGPKGKRYRPHRCSLQPLPDNRSEVWIRRKERRRSGDDSKLVAWWLARDWLCDQQLLSRREGIILVDYRGW